MIQNKVEDKVTHRRVRSLSLGCKYLYQDIDRIGLLENIKQCDIHAQMLDAFEESNEGPTLYKFARSQGT